MYDPTDLVAYRDDADQYPDVIVYDFNYGDNGRVGWAECPEGNTGTGGSGNLRWCRGQRVRFNEFYEASDFDTATRRRRIACHELGHTLGLRHYDAYHGSDASCTANPPANAGDSITSHERSDHINDWY